MSKLRPIDIIEAQVFAGSDDRLASSDLAQSLYPAYNACKRLGAIDSGMTFEAFITDNDLSDIDGLIGAGGDEPDPGVGS